MSEKSSSSQKICPSCKKAFECCTSECWCSSLPNIMPLDEGGKCYCKECLDKIIDNKFQEKGLRRLPLRP